MQKVVDDLVVRFVDAKRMGIDAILLICEEFEVCKVFSDLRYLGFDFDHSFLELQKLVGFWRVLEFLEYGVANKAASVPLGNSQCHFIINRFRDFGGNYSGVCQCVHRCMLICSSYFMFSFEPESCCENLKS